MTRMTCKQALGAIYKVFGKHSSGVTEIAFHLDFHAALRYYNRLISEGYTAYATPTTIPPKEDNS